jgi:hypothetical protein
MQRGLRARSITSRVRESVIVGINLANELFERIGHEYAAILRLHIEIQRRGPDIAPKLKRESERPLGDKLRRSALNERDTHPAGGRRQGAIFVRLAPIAPARQ